MSESKYTIEGVSGSERGLRVFFKRETGGVPRFEDFIVPWVYVIAPAVMRELVMRHTRSMEAPPPWDEGDVTDKLC